MPKLFWVILAIGVICTAIPTYKSYVKNKDNKKEAIKKTVSITIYGVVATLALAIVASFIFDRLKMQENGNGTDSNISSYTDSNTSAGENISIINDPTKYVTVYIDPNGGSIVPSEIEVKYGGTYQNLPYPKREHFVFLGWYTEVVYGNEVTNYTEVEIPYPHTLYAKWRESEFQVPNVVGKTYDEAKYELERCGFTVLKNDLDHSTAPIGEVTYQSLHAGEYLKSGSRITLDVSNGKKKVKVILDLNYGSITPTFIEVEYEGMYAKLPAPERTNYTFDGWYTESVGGQLVINDTVVNEGITHSLYAHWKEDNRLYYDVPINHALKPFVSATIERSKLNIKVNKDALAPNGINLGETLKWDIYMSVSPESYSLGDYALEMTIAINDDYTTRYSFIEAFTVTGENSYFKEKTLSNHINVTFDGKYFCIECEINNEYIATEDICIYSVGISP